MPMMPLYILAYLRGPNMVQYFIGGKEYLKVFSSGEKSIKALRKHVQRLTLKFIILLISTVQVRISIRFTSDYSQDAVTLPY